MLSTCFVIQFEDIRRVLHQDLRLAPMARGIMGNAQQPICSLRTTRTSLPAYIGIPASVSNELLQFCREYATILPCAHNPVRRKNSDGALLALNNAADRT